MAGVHFSDAEPILPHEELKEMTPEEEEVEDDARQVEKLFGKPGDHSKPCEVARKKPDVDVEGSGLVDRKATGDGSIDKPDVSSTNAEKPSSNGSASLTGKSDDMEDPSSPQADVSDDSFLSKYREDRGRSLSVPLHATVLSPPTVLPTARFYDGEGDEGIVGNGIAGDSGIVDQKTSPSSLGSTNELRNFAVTVESGGEGDPADLDAVERAIQWDLNYQEAAIYLEEGANNDKFDTHPRDQASLPGNGDRMV